jgi:hypothetical protein
VVALAVLPFPFCPALVLAAEAMTGVISSTATATEILFAFLMHFSFVSILFL